MTHRTRGAALLIAVAILAVLLAIAFSFYTASGYQFKGATNVANARRATLLSESGLALAVSFLNHDASVHRTYCSLDHAWRTYFNGAWAAGKPYAWRATSPVLPPLPLTQKGAPEAPEGTPVNDDLYIPRIQETLTSPRGLFAVTSDVGVSPVASLLETLGWGVPEELVTGSPDIPFDLPSGTTRQAYPAEQVAAWCDYDNDGDGLNDSIWIPIAAERVKDQDGLDNDLDGDIDEPGEYALFLYYGGGDGQDNDRDGAVDEDDEDRVFLTAPLVDQRGTPFATSLSIETADGTVTLDPSPGSSDVDLLDNDYTLIVNDSRGYAYDTPTTVDGEVEVAARALYPIAKSYFPGYSAEYITSSGEPMCEVVGRIAVLINDESSKVNANTPGAMSMRDYVTSTGTMTSLVGPVTRALDEGVSGAEYDPRLIPGFGVAFTSHLWALRTGEPIGDGFVPDTVVDASAGPAGWDLNFPGYARTDDNGDALWLALNGIDDDGDAPLYQSDGINNDPEEDLDIDEPGEGVKVGVDEGFTPYDYDGDGDTEYASFEGIDEPGEYRLYQPLRNWIMESDGVDNDEDDATDEIGEGGDRILYTPDQTKLMFEFKEGRFEPLRNVFTTFSEDKNGRYRYFTDQDTLSDTLTPPGEDPFFRTLGFGYADTKLTRYSGRMLLRPERSDLRVDYATGAVELGVRKGLKLHYNYSRAEDIAWMLTRDWDYPMTQMPDFGDTVPDLVGDFALGLRQESLSIWQLNYGQVLSGMDTSTPELGFAADRQLKAYQLGATVQDGRDMDFARTEVTTSVEDTWWDNVSAVDERRPIRYTQAGLEAIRINEIMVRPVRRIEAEAITNPATLLTTGATEWVTGAVPVAQWVLPIADADTLLASAMQFCPNLFSNVPLTGAAASFGVPAGLAPDFDCQVSQLDWHRIVDLVFSTNEAPLFSDRVVVGDDDDIAPARIGWRRLGSHIGEYSGVLLPALAKPEATVDDDPLPLRSHVMIDVDDDPLTHETTTDDDVTVPAVTEFKAPNLVQFRFGPSPKLPPGRYYLLANTRRHDHIEQVLWLLKNADGDGDGRVTYDEAFTALSTPISPLPLPALSRQDFALLDVDATDDVDLDSDGVLDPILSVLDLAPVDTVPKGAETRMRFVLKYGTATADILADLEEGAINLTGSSQEAGAMVPYGTPIVGVRRDTTDDGAEGTETGWIMLPSSSAPMDDLAGDAAGYWQDYGYTVTIPDYAAAGEQQQYLYVGIWKNEPNDVVDAFEDYDLAVNFFEFSQEPDHEWVELVNTAEYNPRLPRSEQAVDISGWQLEVGGDGSGRGRTVATIPDGTALAPGGSLLLTFDKFDAGGAAFTDTDFAGVSDIHKNGIGMCSAPEGALAAAFAGLADVTVPPFPAPDPAGTDLGESVFYRGLDATDPTLGALDFVDRDGDGVFDANTPDDYFASTTDDIPLTRLGVVPPVTVPPTDPRVYLFATAPALIDAWLPRRAWDRVVELQAPVIEEVLQVEALAALVLEGGIFPNYPEQDGLDNDGDDALLEDDGVDNDGDSPAAGTLVDEAYEGVDEGQRALGTWGNGNFGATPLELPFTPRAYTPGSFSGYALPYGAGELDPGDPTAPAATYPSYLGAADDPPAWKEFVERRFFPGDCVIVTLYQGNADSGRVVDRISYTERDVTNASINDLALDEADAVVECPYQDFELNPVTLNEDYPTFWPDNTMGVDFYRSLERTHPLETGDRFGTQNRWQATDAAFDAWASNMGDIGVLSGVDGELLARAWLDDDADRLEYVHGLQGSPLRMNFTQRAIQGLSSRAVATPFGEDWLALQIELAGSRNRNYTSPGDLATLAHLSKEITTATLDSTLLPFGTERYQNFILGGDSVQDLTALLSSGSHDAIVLTCGQATFYPVACSIGEVLPDVDAVSWDSTTGTLPTRWAPVFLYSLGDTSMAAFPYLPSYPVDELFLFAEPATAGYPFPAGMLESDVLARWPLASRAVMYVSSNPTGFDPDTPDHALACGSAATRPAEAFFVWDADDGVENGEYDVFVGVGDDLSALANSDLLTSFGDELLTAAGNTFQREMGVDVEIFSDRDGDRTVWTDAYPDSVPQFDELHRGQTPAWGGAPLPDESFGLLAERTPDTDGLVHYGSISVQYNQVALFLRNWAKPGDLNRFSRIVLTPRQRTTGRFNINTATTRPVEREDLYYPYNPLMGLPGLLATYSPEFGLTSLLIDSDDPSPTAASITSYDPSDALERPYWEFAYARDGATWISNRKPEWPDGRYYMFPSDLIGQYRPPGDDLMSASKPLHLAEILDIDMSAADADAAEKYRETIARYARIANLITTRSDVFEITVTAQAGYTVDENGDGWANYRTDNEFVVMGEKRVSMVYERREPPSPKP